MKDALIIFAKNPILGNAKTRIAQSSSPEKALEIYLNLLGITLEESKSLPMDKIIYWDEIPTDSSQLKHFDSYYHKVQSRGNLGDRLKNAFLESFQNYQNLVVIGSDCPELKSEILLESFQILKENRQIPIGPALDGGYYLLGLYEFREEWFQNIPWSTEKVLELSLNIAKKMNYSVNLLPELRDIDEWEDYQLFFESNQKRL
jgi:hypothetical protein